MIESEIQLVAKYARKGIVVDTNLLLLLFVGYTNRDRIQRFSRTEKFTPDDYDCLGKFLGAFEKIVVTPNILTEVNSMLNQLSDPDRSKCARLFSQLISKYDEQYVVSQEVAKQESFVRFGLTDCGIVDVAKDKYLVITEDFKLTNHLLSMGVDTINFNHIRMFDL